MKNYIFIVIFVMLLGACTNELEQINPNVITQENFWKTENDVLLGLAATYKTLKSKNTGYWNSGGIPVVNGRGDDFYIRNDVADLYRLSTFVNASTNGKVTDIFQGAYQGIFRANQIIENVPGVEGLDDGSKAAYIAEAKFLRALNYFYLVINFGDVAIVTSVPKTKEDYFIKQSPQADVWIQIENDLKDAKDGLPVTYASKWVGRATKGAAIGFLGKAYIYEKKWELAQAEFSNLIDANGNAIAPYAYDLLVNYSQNFEKEYDNNKESLFEIQFQNVGGTNLNPTENATESQGSVSGQFFAPAEVGGWFEGFPTNKMFDEFQKEKTITNDFDPRMYASIVWNYPGAVFYTKPFSGFTLQFGFNSMIKKYQNWKDKNEGIKISEINEKALRFADILLLQAEALTMQNKVTEAYPFINRIRSRANLVPLTIGKTKDDMMSEIRHQRMVEFFREGQRFYDLKRWGLLQQEMTNSDKVGKEFYDSSKDYFPIPQNELNTNPNW
ncbi:RagB/SusD family nutrient uptake outer membrane protein [Flavobacterium sp. 7A]|uniref:RagB/SusD family nutrient uptake outer membrane protein n=1 Tax=Flavobacterium sp. 7A TaxID=2940571 RepID=UPI002225D3DB|nr:RagB/SusD family nutrient uptake outer membrane protein [Flavobacterium sp. 7A]MCW2118820.1 tetratricopeptide (TPR) repeat protein [Flavobacterium sp. 7A]